MQLFLALMVTLPLDDTPDRGGLSNSRRYLEQSQARGVMVDLSNEEILEKIDHYEDKIGSGFLERIEYLRAEIHELTAELREIQRLWDRAKFTSEDLRRLRILTADEAEEYGNLLAEISVEFPRDRYEY
jgi:hypothetical protein